MPLSLTGPMGLKLFGPVAKSGPTTQVLAIAAGGQTPLTNLGSPPSGKTRLKSRLKFYVHTAATEIAAVFCNKIIDLVSGEINGPQNVTIVKAAFEKNGGTTVPATFAGARNKVLAPGDVDIVTDYATLAVVPGDYIWFRSEQDVVAGTNTYPISKLYRDTFNEVPGIETSYAYDPANEIDDVDGTGALGIPTGATANQNPFRPVLLIGKVANGSRAVIGFGDSIADADDDLPSADGSFGGGFMRRAAFTAGVPYTSTARSAQRADKIVLNSTMVQSLLKYHTHMWVEPGHNDMVGGATASQVLTALRTIWSWGKAAGLKVWQIKYGPRVTTTDYCMTLENQTPHAAFSTGGTRDQLHTLLAAEVGVNVDDLVDVWTPVFAAGDNTKWKLRTFTATLTADVLTSATSAPMTAKPAPGEYIILRPRTANQSTSTNARMIRSTGTSSPFTAFIGSTFGGPSTHPSGSEVGASPAAGTSPGVHPEPPVNVDMAAILVTKMAA